MKPTEGQEAPDYPLEIAAADLSAYRIGNTGVDFVHSFDAERPGPHVMVNALTHGNELCGMQVVKRLLDGGLRPRAGRLTLSFANVAAYAAFGPHNLEARYLERDFNRLWHDDLLAADTTSVEARRAHAMRPVVHTVDYLLDLHSTWHALLPFFVLAPLPRTRALADRLACPARQLLLPAATWHEGYHLIDYGGFRAAQGHKVGLIAECGQHFAQSSVDNAWRATIRFLELHGSIDHDQAQDLCPGLQPAVQVERFEIVQPVIAATDDVRLCCSYAGFVRFAAGAVAAYDGGRPLLAPFEGAVLLAPRPRPRAGQQVFSWGRAVDTPSLSC